MSWRRCWVCRTARSIESYDISNWGDGTSVCGMVTFRDGKALGGRIPTVQDPVGGGYRTTMRPWRRPVSRRAAGVRKMQYPPGPGGGSPVKIILATSRTCC